MYQYEFIVNGYPVHAQYSEQFINDIAMPLLETWSRMANDKQVLVFLAAPPGVGKSTMALLFETLAVRKGIKLQALGMDGFHHYQKYILSHTVFIDGTEIEMKKVKGCPESFDFERLLRYVQRIKNEEKVLWPLYDRRMHDVVDDQIDVSAPIVLIEGNYLLLDEEPWNRLSDLCDASVFIEADEQSLCDRLIQRKLNGGMAPHEAVAFVRQSDLRNVKRILEHRKKADVTLVFEQGDFKKK